MRKIGSLILCILGYSFSIAQTQVTKVEYQKSDREGLVNEIGYDDKTVSGAIEERMVNLGVKGKNIKGFIVYKGVVLPELGGSAYDLYFSIDRKSRKEKESATITLLISKGDERFVTASSDPDLFTKAKTYLDNLWDRVGVYDLEQQIAEQENLVKKNEKKMNGLIDEASNLEKKKKKIEKDMEENSKDQTSQQKELENQRTLLETLKGKRKQ